MFRDRWRQLDSLDVADGFVRTRHHAGDRTASEDADSYRSRVPSNGPGSDGDSDFHRQHRNALVRRFVIRCRCHRDRSVPDGSIKVVADANLFEPPPKRTKGKNGRPAIKGRSLPCSAMVAKSRRRGKTLRVRWYGGGWRNVKVYTGVGCWYKSGKGIVTIRWVYVIDLDGTHRDECFFATAPSMSPEWIIEMYGGRWNIETTFQEMREHFGLETTRGGSENTVLRMGPSLFLLYTIVVVF
jgi:hypothetical protein